MDSTKFPAITERGEWCRPMAHDLDRAPWFRTGRGEVVNSSLHTSPVGVKLMDSPDRVDILCICILVGCCTLACSWLGTVSYWSSMAIHTRYGTNLS